MSSMSARNPPIVPADTSVNVWRRQLDAIAKRSVADRFDEWQQLNDAMAKMEADGVRRRHPDYDDHTVLLALVRLRYGDALVRAAWPNEALVEA